MKIEAGKFYRTRSDNKARVYAVDAGGGSPIHGAILIKDAWYAKVFQRDGNYHYQDESPFDLISEWVDRPVVDWSKLAAWHRWVAMDEDGSWYAYSERPELACATWRVENTEYQRIPENYSPTFSGDWKDSLVERPTE